MAAGPGSAFEKAQATVCRTTGFAQKAESFSQHLTKKKGYKMNIMDKMMQGMMGKMSKEEKKEMMSSMMDRFFAEMTPDDKQKMILEMMPKMVEGMNMMDMMPKMMMNMMGESKGDMMQMCRSKMGESGMPEMMSEMMPKCLNMMLPKLSKKRRRDFVLKMTSILLQQGCKDLSENEKADFMKKIDELVKSISEKEFEES